MDELSCLPSLRTRPSYSHQAQRTETGQGERRKNLTLSRMSNIQRWGIGKLFLLERGNASTDHLQPCLPYPPNQSSFLQLGNKVSFFQQKECSQPPCSQELGTSLGTRGLGGSLGTSLDWTLVSGHSQATRKFHLVATGKNPSWDAKFGSPGNKAEKHPSTLLTQMVLVSG